jgi:hypothetical protein
VIRALLLGAFVAVLVTPSLAASDLLLTIDGVGNVRIGMTLRESGRTIGARISVPKDGGSDDPQECSYARRADGRDANISYMMHRNRIVRIDIGPTERGQSVAAVRTAEGIGLGSSEKQLRQAYGRRVRVEPHPYGDANDHYYVLKDAGGRRGIIFETWDGRVSQFRVGRYPEVRWIEGCS